MPATSSSSSAIRLPAVFQRLAWSNLAAQSAEQISLAAAPLVAVFALGADARGTGPVPPPGLEPGLCRV